MGKPLLLRVFLMPFLLLLVSIQSASAQAGDQLFAYPDVICVQAGDPINYNVLANDLIPPGVPYTFQLLTPSPCVFLDSEGNLQWTQGVDQENCCGPQPFMNYLLCLEGGDICSEGLIELTIKCDVKPDCTLFNLEDLAGGDGTGVGGGDPTDPNGGASCIYVCENSETTFFVDYNPAFTYTWTVVGGAGVTGVNDAEHIVTWGPAGTGYISLVVTDGNGFETTYETCVEILPGPTALFTVPSVVCKDASFTPDNLSLNADDYFWDWGDNTTSTGFEPSHSYNTAGTYTITLTAIKYNYDEQGNPLCCCTDTYSVEITVDPLSGPPIYWISTLCEGDSSCYWTTATGCTDYQWQVLDANGVALPFSGNGNDTICVTWGSGPFGTIILNVVNCDQEYCPEPTTVTVPIISSTGIIDGETVVCENATEIYCLPKWPGTTYNWTVTGGMVVPGTEGHCVEIMWGSAGVGTIHVEYYNEFLAGLPGHDYPDCYGVADLTVNILPSFGVDNFGPSIVCVGDGTTLFATAAPSSNYNWTVSPSHPFTGNGTNVFATTWTAPGTYVITATPNDPNAYCNASKTKVITVKEALPPLGIDGPLDVCPGGIYYYDVQANGTGVDWIWSVTGGTLSSSSGGTVGVTWDDPYNPSNPYTLTVQQVMLNQPYCVSPPVTITVNPILLNGPLVITGSGSCTNQIGSYNLAPPQHPSAQITWSVNQPTYGSVVGGQGTYNATIQWNNTATLAYVVAEVEVCGNVLRDSIAVNLIAPIQPVITQIGNLCPGVPATLQVAPGFTSYSWTGGTTPTNTSSVSISSAGPYSVTTVDVNGCIATDYFTANNIQGPVASISSPDPGVICLGSPTPFNIFAQTNAGYIFEWFCNGVSQGPPSPSSTFSHVFQGVAGTYCYIIEVTDTNTGCMATSDPLCVTEDPCDPLPGCDPEPTNVSPLATVQFPACNTVNFSYTSDPNFTFGGWSFGDGNFGGSPTTSHVYTTAGCYNIIISGTVPNLSPPPATCNVSFTTGVCVPLAADFDIDILSCTDVQFTDLSTWILSDPGNTITTWSWNFNGYGTSNLQNPFFTFPVSGVHPVTLTVTSVNGCTAQITYNVNIGSVGTPVITIPPGNYCVGDPINMSAFATGAVSYTWDFGDFSSFVGANPQKTYTTAGTYIITVTAEDAEGCQASASVPITIYPGIPDLQITANPGLTICQGSTTQLIAPAGYSYQWSTGATTQTINVGAGTYSVTLQDSDGCTRTLDPVEVVELPLPPANISGDLFICDAGCTTLSAPYSAGYTYQWYDAGAAAPLPGEILQSLVVCDFNLAPGGYFVEVTDANGCTNASPIVIVQMAASPVISLSVTPDNCAGTPSTIAVIPGDPSLNYNWSTGATTTSIIVSLPGTYSVLVTDPVTGCSTSASEVIHPLPDFCIITAGCYEACNPDTLCGPPGMAFYQWNLNGLPIPAAQGGNDECIEVTISGSYTLTATTTDGCTDTSDQIILELIDCDDLCADLILEYAPVIDADGNVDECCVSLSYTNPNLNLQGLTIYTNDADLDYTLASISGGLQYASGTANSVSLQGIPGGSPIPTGAVSNFFNFCLTNVVNSPQTIVIDWYDMENMVACSDTIILNCPPEPDCLYLAEDSIYCVNGETFYNMTLCNPASSTYSIGYVSITPSSPAGIVITPPAIIPGTPIAPGTCQTFVLQLSGPGIAGQDFCYNLVAHEEDPELNPATLCCSLDTTYCITIPQCDPCISVGIELVEPSSQEDCCYVVTLYNDYDPAYFDEIGICVISPQTTISVNNPFGSGWTTSGFTGTEVSFLPNALLGNFVPGGVFSLPEICVDTQIAPNQQIEIKWMANGEIVCRDTIEVSCEPPCGYLLQEEILCGPNGTWNFSSLVKNTAPYVVSEAVISFPSSTGLDIYNTTIPLGGIPTGGIGGPINFTIGAPALPGDTICFTVTLHEINADGIYLSCCNFTHCIVLPDCPVEACVCDESFYMAVATGFTATQSAVDPNTFSFNMNQFFNFGDCDLFRWSWGHSSPSIVTNGPAAVMHTFPGPGSYNVCVRVTRTMPDGTQCFAFICQTVTISPIIGGIDAIVVYPNPNDGRFMVEIPDNIDQRLTMEVLDYTGRPVQSIAIDAFEKRNRVEFDLRSCAKGMYYLRIMVGEEIITKKVSLQ